MTDWRNGDADAFLFGAPAGFREPSPRSLFRAQIPTAASHRDRAKRPSPSMFTGRAGAKGAKREPDSTPAGCIGVTHTGCSCVRGRRRG